MSDETTNIIKETSNRLGPATPQTHEPSHFSPIKPKQSLTFLRPENLLAPAHRNYVPPTAIQIRDLAMWGGVSGGGKQGVEKLADAANTERFQMARWTNTNIPIDECPTVPGPVWQYLLIRLGVVEQMSFRRAEPSTNIVQTFTLDDREPLALRAKLWYEQQEIVVDVFDDSIHSQSRKDGKPIFSIELTHDKSEFGNSIGGKLRHDEPEAQSWDIILAPLAKAHNAQRLPKELLPYYLSFFDKKIWKALWDIHDFHSISPRDFLKQRSIDPFRCKPEELPTHRELLSFIKWAGLHRNELAYICGETPKRLAFLSSVSGEERAKKAQEQYDKGEINAKNLASIRWANVISRHAWALMLSAFGLAPSIPVLGRQSPEPRKVRTFEIESVHGVPTKFLKIETHFSFRDPAYTQLSITGRTSTQQGAGEEWVADFKITLDLENQILVDGTAIGKQSEPPASWKQLSDKVPDFAKSYIDKALWHTLGRYLRFYYEV